MCVINMFAFAYFLLYCMNYLGRAEVPCRVKQKSPLFPKTKDPKYCASYGAVDLSRTNFSRMGVWWGGVGGGGVC